MDNQCILAYISTIVCSRTFTIILIVAIETWDYIKDVVEPSERRRQLKGGKLLFEEVEVSEPHKNTVDAVWTHKMAK